MGNESEETEEESTEEESGDNGGGGGGGDDPGPIPDPEPLPPGFNESGPPQNPWPPEEGNEPEQSPREDDNIGLPEEGGAPPPDGDDNGDGDGDSVEPAKMISKGCGSGLGYYENDPKPNCYPILPNGKSVETRTEVSSTASTFPTRSPSLDVTIL